MNTQQWKNLIRMAMTKAMRMLKGNWCGVRIASIGLMMATTRTIIAVIKWD